MRQLMRKTKPGMKHGMKNKTERSRVRSAENKKPPPAFFLRRRREKSLIRNGLKRPRKAQPSESASSASKDNSKPSSVGLEMLVPSVQ